jgi:hypothetical protein
MAVSRRDVPEKGRRILTSVAALTAVGGFLADWNHSHLFNPNWPPHAKFHDALSILLGSLVGASFAFPGAEGFEAEFPQKVPWIKGVWINERFSSALMLAPIAIGYAAERGRRA